MARELDVRITAVTDKEVRYDLTHSHQSLNWRIPKTSTFDTGKLQVGKRYSIQTRDMLVNGRTVYEWVSVHEHKSRAQLAQDAASKNPLRVNAAMLALGFNPELFDTCDPQAVPASIRPEVEELIEAIALDNPTEAVLALLNLLCAEIDARPDLFGGSA